MTLNPKAHWDRIQIQRDYAEVFGTPAGDRVLRHIIATAGLTKPQFHADPERARLFEGHRHLAYSIFRMARSSGDKLPDYLTEELNKKDS
jgi:hypothetical protein